MMGQAHFSGTVWDKVEFGAQERYQRNVSKLGDESRAEWAKLRDTVIVSSEQSP